MQNQFELISQEIFFSLGESSRYKKFSINKPLGILAGIKLLSKLSFFFTTGRSKPGCVRLTIRKNTRFSKEVYSQI